MAGLGAELLLGQPGGPQLPHRRLAGLRVDVRSLGLGCGDPFRRPILRIDFSLESTLVSLRAVRLAIPHAVSGFAFAGLVSGDVGHFYYLLNNGRFTF